MGTAFFGYARAMRCAANLLVVVTLLGGVELPAEAQGASSTTVARRLFREGIREARRRNWQEAHDAFSRSYELSPRSTTLLNLAGTQRQLGRWVAAAESYRRFLSSNDERGRRARQQNQVAERALEELEAQIPNLRVNATGELANVVVTIDDEEMAAAAYGELFPLDPGEHHVVIQREGHRSVELDFTLEEGGEHVIDVADQAWRRIVPEPREVAVRDVVTDPEPIEDEPEGRPVRRSPALWITVTLVVVGGVLGGVLGARAAEPARYEGNVPPGRLRVPD